MDLQILLDRFFDAKVPKILIVSENETVLGVPGCGASRYFN